MRKRPTTSGDNVRKGKHKTARKNSSWIVVSDGSESNSSGIKGRTRTDDSTTVKRAGALSPSERRRISAKLVKNKNVEPKKPLSKYRNLSDDPTPVTLAHIPYIAFENHPIIEVLYGIDKLEIISRVNPEILIEKFAELGSTTGLISKKPKILSIVEEKENKWNKRYKYSDAFDMGFLSIFRCVNPTESFFDLLIENEQIFGKGYLLWHIELFQDLVVETDEDAILINDLLVQTTYKLNYSRGDKKVRKKGPKKKLPYVKVEKSNRFISEKVYQKRLRSKDAIRTNQRGILSEKTLYLGDGDARFVSYARFSKTALPDDKIPCVHREWRLQWNKNYKVYNSLGIVKKRVGYLLSLKNLTGLKASISFIKFTKKYIRYAEINKVAVAKHFFGMSDKKKFTKGDAFKLKQYYSDLEYLRRIENTAEFIRYCKKFELDERRFLRALTLMSE